MTILQLTNAVQNRPCIVNCDDWKLLVEFLPTKEYPSGTTRIVLTSGVSVDVSESLGEVQRALGVKPINVSSPARQNGRAVRRVARKR
jgi:hypothetical protein